MPRELLLSLQGWGTAGVILALLLCLWKPSYKWLRHLGTLVHEVGHAVAGLLTGARLRGIALNPDASGQTVTGHYVGLKGSFSRFVTTIAGYPAPALFATLMLAGLITGIGSPHSWGWWVMLTMSGLCLLFARSWFTLVVASVFAVPPVLFLFIMDKVPHDLQSAILWFVCTVLIWSSYQSMAELTRISRHDPQRETDASAITQATKLPLRCSVGLLWVLTVISSIVIPIIYVFLVHISDR